MFNQFKTQIKKAVAAARTIVPPATPWPVAVKPVDKIYPERISSTPNMSGTLVPEGIVLHHSGGGWAGLEPWLQQTADKKRRVSYHCIVNVKGERVIMVPDNKRAWHAGRSFFKGKSSCNNFLLGCTVTGNSNTRELTQEEIVSVAQWCIAKMKMYNFGTDMITTHAVIAPGRKTDISARAYEQIIEAINARI